MVLCGIIIFETYAVIHPLNELKLYKVFNHMNNGIQSIHQSGQYTSIQESSGKERIIVCNAVGVSKDFIYDQKSNTCLIWKISAFKCYYSAKSYVHSTFVKLPLLRTLHIRRFVVAL